MAVYQVYNTFKIGFTTDYEQVKEFLKEVNQEGIINSGGIYLLALNEDDGQLSYESFVNSQGAENNPLRKITPKEIRKLPYDLYITQFNIQDAYSYDVFITDESRLSDLMEHEHNEEYQDYSGIFRQFGKYSDNFGAYMILRNVINKQNDMSY